MKYPLAYLITWTTYGTWLHGDERGSFDAHGKFIPPDPVRRAAAEESMSEFAVTLTDVQRQMVDARLVELCRLGNWVLHARNVRANHVHVVISAAMDGEVLRSRLKAGCSITLSEHAGLSATDNNGAKKWWTQKGNVEEIWDDRHLQEAIEYVNERQ
jgi:REP element-mobilizing transposase RayT